MKTHAKIIKKIVKEKIKELENIISEKCLEEKRIEYVEFPTNKCLTKIKADTPSLFLSESLETVSENSQSIKKVLIESSFIWKKILLRIEMANWKYNCKCKLEDPYEIFIRIEIPKLY